MLLPHPAQMASHSACKASGHTVCCQEQEVLVQGGIQDAARIQSICVLSAYLDKHGKLTTQTASTETGLTTGHSFSVSIFNGCFERDGSVSTFLMVAYEMSNSSRMEVCSKKSDPFAFVALCSS